MDPAQLTIVDGSLSVFLRPDGSVAILGEVRNDGERAAAPVWVQVAATDAEGNLRHASQARVVGARTSSSVPDQTILPPGEVAYFSAQATGPGMDAIVGGQARAYGYETDSVDGDPVPLELVGEWELEDSPFGTHIDGTVRNNGTTDVVGLRATVVIRSVAGQLLAIEQAFPTGQRIGGYLGGLRAGEELDVAMELPVAPAVAAESLETFLGGIPYDGGRFRYGVAGVAHVNGVGGAPWRSSLTLTNHSGADGAATVTFHFQAGSVAQELELPDGASWHSDDVVRNLFTIDAPAAGYVQVLSDVPLAITGRTTNEGSTGGYGQALPVFTPDDTFDLTVAGPGLLAPLRGGPRFRTNLGLVNMADEACSATVELYTPDGLLALDLGEITLPATSWRQVNGVLPSDLELAYATVQPNNDCPIWGYASVIESASGDPTTVFLQPDTSIRLSPWGRGAVRYVPWAGE
jgi:hypothetical protein